MTAQSTDTLRLPEGERALPAEPLTLWERARPPRYAFAGGHYHTACYGGRAAWTGRSGRSRRRRRSQRTDSSPTGSMA